MLPSAQKLLNLWERWMSEADSTGFPTGYEPKPWGGPSGPMSIPLPGFAR